MQTKERKANVCCFVGQREICETEELKMQVYGLIEKLIEEEGVDTFFFGSKSAFNSMCYELTTKIKESHPYIKRIYVRAEFSVINEDYRAYLLESYEDTYSPEAALGAGRAIYIKRNQAMIDKSNYCIFYYKEGYVPKGRKSGTKIALDYANKHKKTIYVFP